MFAVEGWNLAHVVPQKPQKRRRPDKDEASATTLSKRQKSRVTSTESKLAEKTTVPKKDKSKYLPYSKQKTNSGSNVVPVAKERRPRQRTPTPEPELTARKTNQKKDHTIPKEPLARPPKSERESTPPKLFPDQAPPSFSGLSNTANLTPLQKKMAAKLSGARFRWINEKLYTTTGSDAMTLLAQQPSMFEEYHAGFRSQVKDWPSNPLDIYRTRLDQLYKVNSRLTPSPRKVVVLDLGCGEATLGASMMEMDPAQKFIEVKSFDLVANSTRVVACDIAHLPVPSSSANIAIFCLSLMGTDFLDFLREAARCLVVGGEVWVSEIKSRFVGGDVGEFCKVLAGFGFERKGIDESNKMFINLDFVLSKTKAKKLEKVADAAKDGKGTKKGKKEKIGMLLKPCTYKKR